MIDHANRIRWSHLNFLAAGLCLGWAIQAVADGVSLAIQCLCVIGQLCCGFANIRSEARL